MRLHLLGIPHTVTRPEWSHCAFTGKVERFSRMMRPLGYQVVHYGVAGSVSGATEDVVLMEQDEHQSLLGHPYEHGAAFYGADAVDGNACYRQWNAYARDELKARVEPGDVILLPFGHAHAAAVRGLPVLSAGASAIESGIGYYDCLLPWRVYESYAVRHGVMAKEGRAGVSHETTRLEFVAPNYYDAEDWPEAPTRWRGHDAPVVFLGRLTVGKGVPAVLEVAARRPDVPFILAGQGDLDTFVKAGRPIPANVTHVGAVSGAARWELLAGARAILAPSCYVEPFCGSVVEAAMIGTPAITTDFGAFAETVEHGATGFRCATIDEMTRAVEDVLQLSRGRVRRRALSLYSLEAVGAMYDRIFSVVLDATRAGRFPATGW